MNPELINLFEEKGLKFVGHDTEGKRMEVVELDGKLFGFWKMECSLHRNRLDKCVGHTTRF